MFGRPHDIDDTLETTALDDFFGDEAATANAAEIVELHQRIGQVEAQISSQFTSLATYAQIAQEQVEMARAESKALADRTERRLTSLIERERADRIATTGDVGTGVAPAAVSARLDELEVSVAEIRRGLDECLERQRSLADAIATMFERLVPSTPTTPMAATTPMAPPARVVASPFAPPTVPVADRPVAEGPIAGLSLAD